MNRIDPNLRAHHFPAIAVAAASVTNEIHIRGDLLDAVLGKREVRRWMRT
jgi:hypothetical protein